MTVNNKAKKNIQRKYDIIRKEETRKKLKSGIAQLKLRKDYKNGKRLSVYALSKYTGVSRETIVKYPEIMDLIKRDQNPGILLKSAVVKVDRIYSLEEAIGVINELTKCYNSATEKYNELLKINSELNLHNVRLKVQVDELNKRLEKYISAKTC